MDVTDDVGKTENLRYDESYSPYNERENVQREPSIDGTTRNLRYDEKGESSPDIRCRIV